MLHMEACGLLCPLLRRYDRLIRLSNFSPYLYAQVKSRYFGTSVN